MSGNVDEIALRLTAVTASLPKGVRLVAVSKFHPAEAVRAAYDAGQRLFGESHAQEVAAKASALPSDIQWHFIGHLQTNKVRQVVSCCHTIQSVDSERLLQKIVNEAQRAGRDIDVLLQVHVAMEESKFGFTPAELAEAAPRIAALTGEAGSRVSVTGVMGMASNTDDTQRVASDFKAIRQVFDDLRNGAFASNPRFDTLSMGMSHDHDAAIEAGSNMVRIGTDIFGEREY